MRLCSCIIRRPSSIFLTVLLLLLTMTIRTIRAQVDTGAAAVHDEDVIHSKNTQEEDKRLWGSHPHDAHPPPQQQQQQQQEHHHQTPEANSNSNHSSENYPSANTNAPTIPFVAKTTSTSSSSQQQQQQQQQQAPSVSLPQQHTPPQGFPLTARVYTDPVDKLAHFDTDISITLPYWECGVAGSTTVPIHLLHATIRHLLAGGKPNLYASQQGAAHPQMVVCLTRLDILLNSGESQTFQPGHVILLENVVRGGHKLVGHGNTDDMTVLILTLPQHYHAVGKEQTCLANTIRKTHLQQNPCPTEEEEAAAAMEDYNSSTPDIIKVLRQPQNRRKFVLGLLGVAITGLVGDFFGRVAPLWLAVIFGGGCFVAGGTYAFVKAGDYLLEELQLWQERRQLKLVEEQRISSETGNGHGHVHE
jgi:hypothetical protein